MEDPRKTALKNGLRQLSIYKLRKVIGYDDEFVLDEYNYREGKYCPLAVAEDMHLRWWPIRDNDRNERIRKELEQMGYVVNNTKGVEGSFYREHRERDLLIAASEVLIEKLVDESGNRTAS